MINSSRLFRFDFSRGVSRKINKYIKFTEKLDLRPYMSQAKVIFNQTLFIFNHREKMIIIPHVWLGQIYFKDKCILLN